MARRWVVIDDFSRAFVREVETPPTREPTGTPLGTGSSEDSLLFFSCRAGLQETVEPVRWPENLGVCRHADSQLSLDSSAPQLLRVHFTLRGASPAVYSRSDSFASTVNARPAPVPTKRQLDLDAADTPKKARSPATATAAKTTSPTAVPSLGGTKRENIGVTQLARPSTKAKAGDCLAPRPSVKVEVATATEAPPGSAQPVGLQSQGRVLPPCPPIRPSVKQDPQARPAPVPTTAVQGKTVPAAAPEAKSKQTGEGVVPPTEATSELSGFPAVRGAGGGQGGANPHSAEPPASNEPSREEMEGDLEAALERELARDGQPLDAAELQTLMDLPSAEEVTDADELIDKLDEAMTRASKQITATTPVATASLLLRQALLAVASAWCEQELSSVVARMEHHPYFMEYLAEVQSEVADPDYRFGFHDPQEDVVHFVLWLDQTVDEHLAAEESRQRAPPPRQVKPVKSKAAATGLRLAPSPPMPGSEVPAKHQAKAEPKLPPQTSPAKAPEPTKACVEKSRPVATPQVPHVVPKVLPSPKAGVPCLPKPPPAKATAPPAKVTEPPAKAASPPAKAAAQPAKAAASETPPTKATTPVTPPAKAAVSGAPPVKAATTPAKAGAAVPKPQLPRKPAVLEIEKQVGVNASAKVG